MGNLVNYIITVPQDIAYIIFFRNVSKPVNYICNSKYPSCPTMSEYLTIHSHEFSNCPCHTLQHITDRLTAPESSFDDACSSYETSNYISVWRMTSRKGSIRSGRGLCESAIPVLTRGKRRKP